MPCWQYGVWYRKEKINHRKIQRNAKWKANWNVIKMINNSKIQMIIWIWVMTSQIHDIEPITTQKLNWLKMKTCKRWTTVTDDAWFLSSDKMIVNCLDSKLWWIIALCDYSKWTLLDLRDQYLYFTWNWRHLPRTCQCGLLHRASDSYCADCTRNQR